MSSDICKPITVWAGTCQLSAFPSQSSPPLTDSDDEWTSREFRQAYKNAPERLERKAAEKRQREEARETERQRKLDAAERLREQRPYGLTCYYCSDMASRHRDYLYATSRNLRGHVKRVHQDIDILHFEKEAEEHDGWADPAFWERYRNDPHWYQRDATAKKQEQELQIQRKTEQQRFHETQAKLQALEGLQDQLDTERSQSAKQRAAHVRCLEQLNRRDAEFRLMQEPASNDWLLHEGNVYFARDRALFNTYHPIDTTVCLGQDPKQTVSVIGAGTVMVRFKRQLEQSTVQPLTLHGVLHIPAARCNGFPLQRLAHNGWALKTRNDERFTVYSTRTNGSAFCGNTASGRLRISMAGESDTLPDKQHVTMSSKIAIHADRDLLARLAPEAGFLG